MTRNDQTSGDRRRTDSATTVPRAGRREFLAAVGAGVALPSVASTRAAEVPETTSFVETDGAQFVVDGQPVYFNGSNNFWITDDSAGSQQRIDRVFSRFEELGIDLVRMWAHGEAKAGELTLQPGPGEYNEAALKLHDYAVHAARRHGIRLIVALVDNWEHEGGMLQYAEWTGGSSREHFYTDPDARELYENHVETILTRENHITGVEYRNDPTIAMWELANEPRLEADGTEGEGNFDRQAGEHREILGEWIEDMSSYVKDLDDNHLVSTGSEGHFYREDESYPNDTWGGQDFVEHHSYDSIDAASFHWYPDHWWCHQSDPCDDVSEVPLERGPQWIEEHVQIAHEELGKPAYLGEFNVRANRPNENQSDLDPADGHSLATRHEHLQDWYDAADRVDADATSIWQVVLEDTEDHDGFQVRPGDDSADVIRDYGETVRAKSGGDAPIADAAAPQTLRVGETGTFVGSYSRGADGEVAAYEWSFEDGTTASGETVSRAFDEPGETQVELTVTDESGATASDAATVTVEALPEDSFLLEGAGEQVADDVAEFHVASTTVSGEVAVEAKVASVESTSTTAQAGIVVLDDPEVADALGAVAVTPGNGTEQVRSYDASSPVWLERTRDDRSAPLWLRLEYDGDRIYSYASPDGEDWTALDDGQVALGDEFHLGLFVSSNAPGRLCAAQFDAVDWLEDWSSADVGDVEVAGSTTAGDGSGPGPGPCPDADGGSLTVDGQTVCDVNDDGYYRDVNGDGRVGNRDVGSFFENFHFDAWDREAFDYSGNGRVSHGDVVALFDHVV